MLAKERTECINCGGTKVTPTEADPRLAAQEARARATKAADYVRDLRRLLGQAMRDESAAQAAAREAEANARKET